MKRNSITLFLESPGATTPLPWVDNAPDFSGFSEPTLGVLQSSWQAFLDSGEELEVVPDPPPPPPEPNWENFNLALLTDPGYTAVSSTVASVAPSVLIALNMALDNLRKGEISASGFAVYVDAFCQVGQPTTQQREGWATIAAANNLPAEVVAIMAG